MRLNNTLKACAALLFTVFGAHAQTPAKKFGRQVDFQNCGTTQYEALLKRKDPSRAGKEQFEQWLAPKVEAQKIQRLQKNGQSTNGVVTIPVVIHVIHNGDAVGTNENISEGQIMSQLTVLNQDFRKMVNTPGHNTNPVGADIEIEFCLAQQDEAGVNTTGIIRYNLGNGNGWDMEEVEALKAQTQWDPNKYLNIWIVDSITLGGFLPLAGYAQFPTNSGLSGLTDPGMPTTANTDGVVIAADCFGSSDIYPGGNYMPGKDKGRTATHEIGHFFGLRHIWGDEENCNGNDFCNDTPVHAGPNQGCPSAGFDSCPSSPGTDMFQNYMDYTDDDCLNIFTLNQKDRILAVLANSPRRASLTTSNACTPGTVYNNDGSLQLQGLNVAACENTFTPQVIFKNNGSNNITTATISYTLNSNPAGTYTYNGNLAPAEQTTIDLPTITPGFGEHTYSVAITSVNGVADEAPVNDNKSQTFVVATAYNTQQVIISIKTDNYGEETIWALIDSNENPIASNINPAAPFGYDALNSDELYTFTLDVNDNQCYAFGIIDLYADGICCENGNGYYTVTTANGTIIAQGGQFGQQEITYFKIDQSLGMGDVIAQYAGIKLYPNPAATTITLAVPQDAALPDGYEIYNSLGQLMSKGNIKAHTSVIDVNALSTGVYFIKVASEAGTKTLQFIKN